MDQSPSRIIEQASSFSHRPGMRHPQPKAVAAPPTRQSEKLDQQEEINIEDSLSRMRDNVLKTHRKDKVRNYRKTQAPIKSNINAPKDKDWPPYKYTGPMRYKLMIGEIVQSVDFLIRNAVQAVAFRLFCYFSPPTPDRRRLRWRCVSVLPLRDEV